MWFYKGIKVNSSAITQTNHCSINLQNKSCTNYYNYCRKHRKFVKLGTSYNRKYPIQNCEKFSPIVKVNLALFSSVMAIIVPLSLIGLTLSIKGSNQLLIKSIVKGSTPKCYKHTSFLHNALLCSLVLQTQLGASHKITPVKYIKQKT